MIEFVAFNKIPRLSRDIVITEKIDGTNASIKISDDSSPYTLDSGRVVPFMVSSRTRWILPEQDNAGFAKWAYENVDELLKLGPGHHFGEWWGKGIQRGYSMPTKVFSLFNTSRWMETPPSVCRVVPKLYEGPFDTARIGGILHELGRDGSFAAPGYMDPEGIVIFHKASGTLFKKTIKGDESFKGADAK